MPIKVMPILSVALRKESVDRNGWCSQRKHQRQTVALRKESVDRNARGLLEECSVTVALRKESVDRNWLPFGVSLVTSVALRKESVDRNCDVRIPAADQGRRSPQGERG